MLHFNSVFFPNQCLKFHCINEAFMLHVCWHVVEFLWPHSVNGHLGAVYNYNKLDNRYMFECVNR